MPKFAANLTMLFNEVPFMERFEAAAQAGFKHVEFLFPYAFPAADIKARLGLAVLVITHEMHVVKRICDSVSLLEAGLVVESGPLADVVGHLGGRLGEMLLQLPPCAPVPASLGTTLEVLDTTSPGDTAALTEAERHFGADLPVLAGVVEHLGGTTFSRMRVLVPPTLDRALVAAHLIGHGAQSSPSTPRTDEVA